MAAYVDPLTGVMLLVVTGVGALIHLYSIGYMHDDPGYAALLRVPEPVRVLDDDAGARRQLPPALRLLGGGRALLVPADRLLVHAAGRGQAGKKAFIVNRVGDFGFGLGIMWLWTARRHARLRRGRSSGRRDASRRYRDRHRAAALPGRVRQVGAAPAPRVAARRDGRAHAGVGPHPRGDDGDGRRLHGRAQPRALRALGGRARGGRVGRGGAPRSSRPRSASCRPTSSACSRTRR